MSSCLRAFAHAGPRAWKALSQINIHLADTITFFSGLRLLPPTPSLVSTYMSIMLYRLLLGYKLFRTWVYFLYCCTGMFPGAPGQSLHIVGWFSTNIS